MARLMHGLPATCVVTILLILMQVTALYAEQSVRQPIEDIPYGRIDTSLLQTAYSGTEKLRYEISWTGGIKIGELHLEIRPTGKGDDDFELYALVTTADSIFNTIYPVRDVHVTQVRSKERLPYRYEVWQKEGYSYEAHRLTSYAQDSGRIEYRKNDEPVVIYEVGGKTHNEFSSFFSSRIMPLEVGKDFIVPTFADKKRNEVVVRVVGRRQFEETVLGPVETLEVSPIMTFKGLYDKQGDTNIWYTDDECRVPVEITSKIVLGSLTSRLIAYENPACSRYADVSRDK